MQIEELLRQGEVSSASIEPNSVYLYDSTNLHRPPQFTVSGGHRLVLRANTPPSNFPHEIPTSDQLLVGDEFYFTISGSKWEKRVLQENS